MEAEVGVMLTPRKVAQRDVVEVESPAALKVLASLSEAQAQAQIHTSGYKSSFSNASTTYFHSSAADLLAEAAAAADAISTDSSEYDENDDVDDREPILFTTDIANAGAEMIKVRENTKSSCGNFEFTFRNDFFCVFFPSQEMVLGVGHCASSCPLHHARPCICF